MVTIKNNFLVLSMAVVITFATSFVSSAADHEKLAQQMYRQHILPGYADLEKKTKTLRNNMSDLCSAPSEASYEQAVASYKSALLSWSGVEHLRFGPVTHKYRFERFAYWPDIKGRGLRRVKILLRKKDKSVLSVKSLQKKSIAFQGFTALEYLLHGKGKEILISVSDEGTFRCSFGLAISSNIETMAGDILKEWDSNEPFVQAFLKPEESKVYKTPKEVTQELFQAYVAAYDRVKRLKVLNPLGELKKKTPNAKLAPYWRSGYSVDVLMANMSALKGMFLEGGFAEFVAEKNPDLKESVTLSIDNGLRILGGINSPLADIFENERKRKKFKFIASILGVMRGHTGLAIVQAADLTIGFNADDGD